MCLTSAHLTVGPSYGRLSENCPCPVSKSQLGACHTIHVPFFQWELGRTVTYAKKRLASP